MKLFFLMLTPAVFALAQTEDRVVLIVDVDNAVTYRSDIGDYARRGVDTGIAPAADARAFTDAINVGDIVAVNGKPARGLWTSRLYQMGFSPAPAAGFGIADSALGGTADCKWSFHDMDGRFIGSLMDGGYSPHAVTGGTGAFFGVRGQMGAPPPVPLADARPLRVASISEDPARRRILGGGKLRIAFHLIPAERPEVRGVYHEDFSPVTATSPARAGEVVLIMASGLGPLTPGTTPSNSSRFPNPPESVNSPVEAKIGEVDVPVTTKVGWPGETNAYRVDVRIPEGIAAGETGIQLTAAWVPGAVFRIPIRN